MVEIDLPARETAPARTLRFKPVGANYDALAVEVSINCGKDAAPRQFIIAYINDPHSINPRMELMGSVGIGQVAELCQIIKDRKHLAK